MLKVHRWFILVGIVFIVFIFISIDFRTSRLESSFNKWVKEFSKSLDSFGISKDTINRFKKEVKPNLVLVEKSNIKNQQELSVNQKINTLLTDNLILAAQLYYKDNQEALKKDELKYATPAGLVVAMIGINSNFGANLGNEVVINTLATLAFLDQNNTTYKKELVAFLQMVDSGKVPMNFLGQEDGTMSYLGIYPSVYLNSAIDGDEDGVVDLMNSKADIFATGFNILSVNTWDQNNKWGDKVVIPSSVDLTSQQGLDKAKPMDDWKALGVVKENGEMLPLSDYQVTLVLMDNPNMGVLLYNNFNVIYNLSYNLSRAIAVGLLSDQVLTYSDLVDYGKTVTPKPKPVAKVQDKTVAKDEEVLRKYKDIDNIK